MHSIENFIKLFRDETQLTHVFNETATLQDIRQDFPAIAQASGFPLGDISMAYVAGSYARGQQPYLWLSVEWGMRSACLAMALELWPQQFSMRTAFPQIT